ncbi:MAG: DUF4932 domain-containing protein [Flavisolibacter sp.]
MKPFFFNILVLCATLTSFCQTVTETYPKTLWCPNDSFILTFKDYPKAFPFRVSREENESPGTDARPNEYATIYYGKDSIRLNYDNKLPYAHIIFINFESPKGKTTLRFHFNDIASYFPETYMEKNMNNIQFDIPEPYELANIIWTLSPSGRRATDLNNKGDYYNMVVNYFKPYMNHPIFKALDFPDSLYANKYYEFRENSFAFNFQNPVSGSSDTKLLFNGPYYYVYGDELADSSLFGRLKPLVEDFAAQSKFRQFYKNNLGYYHRQTERERQLLPVKKMWTWLEEEFPGTKYQSYRVVFSPLIGGSHSTQRYATYYKSGWFGENVMFICGTDRYDTMPNLSEKQKEGLMSGIVFTEIDHNYVNPATSKFSKLIDSIFSNRNVWAKHGNSSDFYGNPESVFNEYMTHAAFCLYVLDTYDEPMADFVIDNREQLMVNRRNFIRFKEFDRELIRLRQEHKGLKLVELYPYILEWCRKQH